MNGEHKEQDRKEKKKKKKSMKNLPHIEPPSIEAVLRYPIEVWVSTGENFIKPESKW